MATIASLIVNVGANTGGLTSGLRKGQQQVKGFAGSIASIGSSIAALTAGGSAVTFLASSAKAFGDAQEQAAKLGAVLDSTGGAAGRTVEQISALASELQNVTKFEDDATVGAAAVLATFKNVKGQAFDQAIISAQDLSTVMGQDLKSSVVQLGKALNDPTKGIKALTRVGVSFTDQQKNQIKVLQQSGDLLGAQSVVLRELTSEFGGAARAAGGQFLGQLEQLKNKFGDLKESIGEGLAEPIMGVIELWKELRKTIQQTQGATNSSKGEKGFEFLPQAKEGWVAIGEWIGTMIGGGSGSWDRGTMGPVDPRAKRPGNPFANGHAPRGTTDAEDSDLGPDVTRRKIIKKFAPASGLLTGLPSGSVLRKMQIDAAKKQMRDRQEAEEKAREHQQQIIKDRTTRMLEENPMEVLQRSLVATTFGGNLAAGGLVATAAKKVKENADKHVGPEALLKGSSESITAIRKAAGLGAPDAAEKQLTESQKQTQELKSIRKAVEHPVMGVYGLGF